MTTCVLQRRRICIANAQKLHGKFLSHLPKVQGGQEEEWNILHRRVVCTQPIEISKQPTSPVILVYISIFGVTNNPTTWKHKTVLKNVRVLKCKGKDWPHCSQNVGQHKWNPSSSCSSLQNMTCVLWSIIYVATAQNCASCCTVTLLKLRGGNITSWMGV